MCAAVDKSSAGSAQEVDDGFLSIRIDRPTRERLERLARKNERTLSGEIRLALRLHLEQAS